MKRFHNFWLATLILLGGLAVFLWQRETTGRLQREVATRRETARYVERLRSENERLRGALADPDGAKAKQETQTEISRLRLEIATWEALRRPSANKAPMPVLSRASDRVPEKDLTRIENFQNAGQASPSAAYQTFVWALAKDDVSALKAVLYLSSASQQRLQEFWSGLPAESQARFKEPEQILMLLMARYALDEEGLKILGETPQASGDVLLRVKKTHGEEKIPLRPGPAGWQLVLPDEATDNLSQSIAEASLYVAPPVKR